MVEANGDLVLVWISTPLEECERRDRKGLYAKARRGEIPDFTGISSPYEPPEDADLVVDTTDMSIEDAVQRGVAVPRRRRLDPRRHCASRASLKGCEPVTEVVPTADHRVDSRAHTCEVGNRGGVLRDQRLVRSATTWASTKEVET